MKLTFYKYHGAGNDFILIDDRDAGGGTLPPLPLQSPLHPLASQSSGAAGRPRLELSQTTIAKLCDRHFGIGADGLMLLRNHPDYDFEMIYFNADGRPSSMCGNGGRCIVRFAQDLGMIGETCRFLAVDGPHEASLLADGWVSLAMRDVPVSEVSERPDGTVVLDTGSPHYITYAYDPGAVDVFGAGRAVRYAEEFAAEGINVNFVRIKDGVLDIATYERGVEDETLACGTGVTAAAIAEHRRKGGAAGEFVQEVRAKGGDLRVRGTLDNDVYRVWLEGPTAFVFTGEVGMGDE